MRFLFSRDRSTCLGRSTTSAPRRTPDRRAASLAVRSVSHFVRIAGILAAIALAAAPAACDEGDGPSLVRIEEDWEFVVTEPEPGINSPQITFFTCPDAADPECHFQLQMNYAASTSYSSGGFRVSAVRDEAMLDEARSDSRIVLSLDNDTVRWTSVMGVAEGEFLYAVKDGFGSAWGVFGGPEYLVRMPSDGVEEIAGYTPTKSLEMVDVGFGGNRVDSIVLKRVRYYFSDGHVATVSIAASP